MSIGKPEQNAKLASLVFMGAADLPTLISAIALLAASIAL